MFSFQALIIRHFAVQIPNTGIECSVWISAIAWIPDQCVWCHSPGIWMVHLVAWHGPFEIWTLKSLVSVLSDLLFRNFWCWASSIQIFSVLTNVNTGKISCLFCSSPAYKCFPRRCLCLESLPNLRQRLSEIWRKICLSSKKGAMQRNLRRSVINY